MIRTVRALTVLLASGALAAACTTPPKVVIVTPFDEEIVVTDPVPVAVSFAAGTNTAGFTALANGVDVTAAFTVTAAGATASLPLGPALATGRNALKIALGSGDKAVSSFQIVLGNAVAQKVTAGSASLLIDGPNARGRVGDYALYNDLIQVVIEDVSPLGGGGKTERSTYGVHVFGGNIIDADLKRGAGDPERDNFEVLTPLINVEATPNYRTATIVNDGADGNPAVLRFEGPDDLLDTQNLSSLVVLLGGGLFSFPPAFDDADLPIDIVTEYSLAPGANYVTVTTTIRNNGATDIRPPVGDWFNGGGELENFQPGLGFGGVSGTGLLLRLESDYVALTAAGATSAGVSYGYIPDNQGSNNAVSTSGLNIELIDMSIFDLLFGGAPDFLVPAGGTASYQRRFVVGDGDATPVAVARDTALGVPHGRVEGFVASGGQPVAKARVSASTLVGDLFQSTRVVGAFETDAEGHYVGSLPPGTYRLAANAEGYLNPADALATVSAGGTFYQNYSLAQTGALEVSVVDEGGAPIAAKVTVVGIDPSPSTFVNFSVLGLLGSKGGVFRNDGDLPPRGVSAIKFAPPSGAVPAFPLEPGSYKVVVSHGPEYDVHEETVAVSAGSTASVSAVVRRVLDTAGFVSADFHQHATDSFDAPASDTSRVLSNLVEGVDFFVSTDHDFTSDLSPEIAALGAGALIGYAKGIEVTPSDYGHINPWPVAQVAGPRNFGSPDWGRGEVPGEDFPSFGNYVMTPGELYTALRALPPAGPRVVQVNHLNSTQQGTFEAIGVDTGAVPPESRFDPALFRMDPSVTNLFDPGFDAMEIWIGPGNEDITQLMEQNWGDWFNLMNQGLVRTATSDSDSHVKALTQVGSPRNWVASSTDSPPAVDPNEIADSILGGKSVCSNGPFLTASLDAPSTGETAGLGVGEPRIATTTDGSAVLNVNVQAAPWVEFDTVEVYVNTVPTPVQVEDPPAPPEYRVAPTLTLTAGVDFVVNSVPVNGSSRQEASLSIPLSGLGAQDRWVVVAVRGSEGASRTLFPVIPNDIDEGQTLADLFVNDPAEPGVRALAFTNALFIDANGNDVYDPPL